MLEEVFAKLPAPFSFDSRFRRAPKRALHLSPKEKRLAVANALRYVPKKFHEAMAVEFARELEERGRIYAYRFRPEGAIAAKPIEAYEGACLAGKAIQLMMDNNLDFEIALYPYELVTYGETGQVCQNWLQYRLIQHYLKRLKEDETLVLQSGHPLGLFKSPRNAPRVIITNGLMVGLYDNDACFQKAQSLGVANYGQMTAGGLMYIGPQGIVHGTYNTLLIAGRRIGGSHSDNLSGLLYVSSGLGGMSGAQGKAAKMAGAVGVVAEVDPSRIQTRKAQGWVDEVFDNLADLIPRLKTAREHKEAVALAYQGNVVDLLEGLVKAAVDVDLLSDQTSCHAVYEGGYCPCDLSFDERTQMLAHDPEGFRAKVDRSLKKHMSLVEELVSRGSYFFDYGNSFLKSCYDAGLHHLAREGDPLQGFIYPSYVEELLGPELFDYGYGPFRWVCLSGREEDLEKTDQLAYETILSYKDRGRYQDQDNALWLKLAKKHQLVVGSKARILYQDAKGRREIALRFNDLVRRGEVGPIMLGRDHHDTGGTDSPFRETANIKDGSQMMAEMATQCFAGNAARGMTMVALHNGGGVGIGKSINGGFGMLLDGSQEVDEILAMAMDWDVMCGVSRRAFAGNPHARQAAEAFLAERPGAITLPETANPHLIDALFR